MAELAQQGMAPVRTGASVRENLSCHLAQAESIVEFAAGLQPAIGGDLGAVELELEATVEHQSKRSVLRFTRCRFHSRHPSPPISCC